MGQATTINATLNLTGYRAQFRLPPLPTCQPGAKAATSEQAKGTPALDAGSPKLDLDTLQILEMETWA